MDALGLLAVLYFLPVLIALRRGLSGLSLALISGGLVLLPGIGWAVGLWFALTDSPT